MMVPSVFFNASLILQGTSEGTFGQGTFGQGTRGADLFAILFANLFTKPSFCCKQQYTQRFLLEYKLYIYSISTIYIKKHVMG
jgi:hypothetical protein